MPSATSHIRGTLSETVAKKGGDAKVNGENPIRIREFIMGGIKSLDLIGRKPLNNTAQKIRRSSMKGKTITMIMTLVAIVVLVGNRGELKAQVTGMPSQDLMEFYTEWAVLYPMAAYIPALLAYNEMLYEGKKVTANECVKFDEAIGSIASVMKKAWAGTKDATIRKEMQLAADAYINVSKLYAEYHKTGKQEHKEKAGKLLDSAGEHWEKVGKYIESKFGGGK